MNWIMAWTVSRMRCPSFFIPRSFDAARNVFIYFIVMSHHAASIEKHLSSRSVHFLKKANIRYSFDHRSRSLFWLYGRKPSFSIIPNSFGKYFVAICIKTIKIYSILDKCFASRILCPIENLAVYSFAWIMHRKSPITQIVQVFPILCIKALNLFEICMKFLNAERLKRKSAGFRHKVIDFNLFAAEFMLNVEFRKIRFYKHMKWGLKVSQTFERFPSSLCIERSTSSIN